MENGGTVEGVAMALLEQWAMVQVRVVPLADRHPRHRPHQWTPKR